MSDVPASRDRSLIGGLVGRVAPVVMRQIDTNDLVEALDVNVIADDLDLDALVGRLDVNAIADRLDLDALVDRMDINAIAGELDMAKITAGATQDVASSGVDLIRRQIIRGDATVDGFVDRILRRDSGRRPLAPTKLAELENVEATEPETHPHDLERRDVSGHYAGPVTRGLSIIGDVAAVAGLQALTVSGLYFLFEVVLNLSSDSGAGAWIGLLALTLVFMAWFWLPIAFFGRTIGMAVLGVGVVRRDGGIVDGRRAFVRTLFFPISILFPFCFIGLVVGKERRALHDVIAGTTVVYDWGARDAEQPATIRQQLSTRVRRRVEDESTN